LGLADVCAAAIEATRSCALYAHRSVLPTISSQGGSHDPSRGAECDASTTNSCRGTQRAAGPEYDAD